MVNREHKKAGEAVAIIKDLDYDWICPSHGNPIQKGAEIELYLNKFS